MKLLVDLFKKISRPSTHKYIIDDLKYNLNRSPPFIGPRFESEQAWVYFYEKDFFLKKNSLQKKVYQNQAK
jgi:hypothetical protein